jgi:hypothetical protein
MSYYFTKANLMDPIEEIPLVATTEAAEASDGDTTDLVQGDDNYTGLD